MPSPLVHITSGHFLYRLYREKLPVRLKQVVGIPTVLLTLAGSSLLPDLDVIPGVLLGDFRRFHNTASHSLFAGVLSAVVIASAAARKRKDAWIAWFSASLLAYELHLFFDLFTGERGLMLFWPFASTRYIAPVKLFYGVQWGLGFFSISHLWTILSETLFLLVVLLLLNRYKIVKSKTTC
jgi:membrane-bound metal-dependent hydrolase YbcI (DUF457 family)